jgi:quercetin dioxygenase-like cupin family protein
MTQTQTGPDVVLGAIGNRIIFENEHVRVWELAVEPGKDKGMHRHDLPYVIVPMTGGDIEIITIDGQSIRPKDVVGEAIWREAGEVHNLHNRGAGIYRNVLVEIKTADKS